MARTKWEPHPETLRVCGKGALGVYHGPPLWAASAVDKARARLAAYVPETWVEVGREGGWRRARRAGGVW